MYNFTLEEGESLHLSTSSIKSFSFFSLLAPNPSLFHFVTSH